jgi:hypothetical protein
MGILKDGIGTIMTFGKGPNFPLYGEVELTPPGVNMGGPIDLIGLRTVGWAPAAAQSIKRLQPLNVKIMFDPELVPTAYTFMGRNQVISVRWPTLATLNWYGWIEDLNFEPHQPGQRPLANMVIQPSNLNPNCVLTGPWWTTATDILCA